MNWEGDLPSKRTFGSYLTLGVIQIYSPAPPDAARARPGAKPSGFEALSISMFEMVCTAAYWASNNALLLLRVMHTWKSVSLKGIMTETLFIAGIFRRYSVASEVLTLELQQLTRAPQRSQLSISYIY
ncbi:hypothetical protein M752DRAFT_17011 [Aspergillus phoenicis ATCC 13157]|uniref:Uncharacterized protein n=1 Tax=Aspergillus phoenicis ATCC 13157 TaxID=1353007 RepID=A0A370PJZ2_ASPPH|nr:hypothetical protein M752DRAFT_17011 [Aspergillus phoenicis ATCC 13157]